MYSIGVDIGGMSVKIGLVSTGGKIVGQERVKTANSPELVVSDIINVINRLLKDNGLNQTDLLGIGVGCPGAVNSEQGIVDFLPNLGWEKVELVKMLKKHFDLPIKISNDANVATLAEVLYGSAKDYNSAIMFTLGTAE